MENLISSEKAPPRILHLEDTMRDAELIRETIHSEMPCEVEHVRCRVSFEAALQRDGFDLILCDYNLPDYDGLTALQLAKSRKPNVPVIVISGAFSPEEAVECIRAGATDYLFKQRPERLVSAVRRALEQVKEHQKSIKIELALRESERLGRAALDALNARVAILDEHGGIITTNQSWRDFADQNGLSLSTMGVGVTHLTGCTCAPENLSDQEPPMEQGIREVLTGQQEEFMLEYSCHSPKEKRWFFCRVTRFASAGAVRVVVAHENITQMKLHERQLLRNQRMESIGTLAGGVAHDLNNSLAPIMMGVEMLKTQYPNETQILDIFQNSAKRGADMVRQLLGFAKGMEGKHVPLQIIHSIKEMESMMKSSFPKNIELVVECEPELPTVLGDSTQLHQVLLNLCVNARDAMPDGGKLTLEVRSQQVDATFTSLTADGRPGKYVLLQVRDTGTGIPPEIIDRIFDPFFSTKGPDMGTGLGLSTVMGIVKGHGGFMQVYSPPGQGTMFSIYFPADRADLADGGTESLIQPVEEYCGQGETILFVDDDTNLRNITSLVLRRLNFNPLVAIDGMDGLVQMTENRNEVRAVITDLHMPGSDGLSFVGGLRRMLPHIPVMVASGRIEEREKKALEALNVNVFLDKPFTEPQLAAALKKLLAPK